MQFSSHINYHIVMELIVAFFLSPFLFSLSISFVQAVNFSFSTELIHRDSPSSPFFNPSETTVSRLAKAMQRSFNRVNQFNDPNKIVQSPLIFFNGDYLMKISLGTPGTEILVYIASESDFIWIPCLSSIPICKNCTGRMIDPSKSSTFNYVFCKSNECQKNNGVTCISNNCHFSCDSADQVSCPNGDLATDTITLSSINTTLSLPNINFICGNNISSDFPGIGFVGLGHGSLSLISQMDHLTDGKFAYCLVPYSSNQSSKIDFGWKGVVEGDGAVSTPLIQNISIGSYSVILEGITVGNKSTVTIGEINGAYIDTGTMLTYLPSDAYDLLQQEVIKAINQKPMEEDDTPRLPLCYLYTPEFNPPIITINLRGGNVELGTGNTFIRVTQDVVCFAFAPSSGKEAIIGNWQQMNFLVGYDLKEGIISFKPTDCSKY